MRRAAAALLLISLVTAAQAQDETQNPETLTERSQAQARAVLDRAVNALGGAASIRAIHGVRYRFEGPLWRRLQLSTATPPFEAGTQEETVLLDLKNDRLRADRNDKVSGEESHDTVIVSSGTVTSYNHRSRSVVPLFAPNALRRFSQYYRRLPQLLLRQALDAAGSLRHLGRDEIDGKAHEVISFVTAQGEQVSLYVDATSHLISKCEVLYIDPLTVDEAAEFLFGDYITDGKQRVPRTWIDREAGTTVAKFRVEVEINPAVTDASFVVPHEGYASVEPVPLLTPEVEELAEGVYVLRHVTGRNQHSLAVAFKDHVLVVEAQGSSEGGDRLIERIKQLIPGKPIRYIAPTHHHGDHIGGVRSFIAEGATVITTAATRDVIDTLARAPHFDRLREQPRAPEFLLIEKCKRVLSDGDRTVELIDVGPNPHAREMVIAYLPKERILFEADLFTRPYTSQPVAPAQELTVSFAKRVRELGLKVDRIVGAHGRTTTASEFSALTNLPL